MISISELYIYPVKSLAGIKLTSAELSPFGLKHDRRWMIVDQQGLLLTQREIAAMATIKTAIKDDQLILTHNGKQCKVPKEHSDSRQIKVTVWKDQVNAKHLATQVDQWLSEILGQTCQLIYMPAQAQRQIDPDFAPAKQFVSFADAFPFLLISQASLDDLNQRLQKPVSINRFRPNIVVTGVQAYAEDQWQDLSINDIAYQAVKKCSRCIMPSINQQTGQQDQNKMLVILSGYRKENKKIKFGQNLIYKNVDIINNQIISCGDKINLK